jgi:hypothetical protein
MSWEARRLRVAMAVQRGQHEAEVAALQVRMFRLEARLGSYLDSERQGLSQLEARVEDLDRRVAAAVSHASARRSDAPLDPDLGPELDPDLDPGLGLADDGGPVRPPAVPALSFDGPAGGRAFDVLMGGAPVASR